MFQPEHFYLVVDNLKIRPRLKSYTVTDLLKTTEDYFRGLVENSKFFVKSVYYCE